MTKSVKQKGASDCQIACIAMALGVSYTKVKQKVPKAKFETIWKRGTTHEELQTILKTFGLYANLDYTSVSVYDSRDQEMVKQLLWQRRAMLSVASLNNNHGSHALYWDGSKLYDPSQKQTYTWLSSVIISRAIIFK